MCVLLFFVMLLLQLPSAALPALLTDLGTEEESAASGSGLLVGTVRNKSRLLKSALICVSWRGDCLQRSCGNTFVTVCALCIISPCVKKSCFASFALYLYFCSEAHRPAARTNTHANTRLQIHTFFIFFPCHTHFPPVFSQTPYSFSVPPFFSSLLTSTHTNSFSSRTSISRHII